MVISLFYSGAAEMWDKQDPDVFRVNNGARYGYEGFPLYPVVRDECADHQQLTLGAVNGSLVPVM